MPIRRVGKLALDGSTASITIGRVQVPCLKASYGDKLDTSTLNNMGSQSIDARTQGTYMTDEGKFTIESVIFRAELMPRFQANGFGNERLPVVIGYEHPDLGSDSDLLDELQFTNIAAAIENSNKAFEVELTAVYNQIYWTEARKTINKLDPSVPLGASQF